MNVIRNILLPGLNSFIIFAYLWRTFPLKISMNIKITSKKTTYDLFHGLVQSRRR